jgi:hypothetical protein
MQSSRMAIRQICVKGTVLFRVDTHPGQTVKNLAAPMGTILQMEAFSPTFMSVLLPYRQFRFSILKYRYKSYHSPTDRFL